MALLNQDNSALKGLLNSPLGARCSQAYRDSLDPVPLACPWLTPAERDNAGFATLTVNVPGIPDVPLTGSGSIACSWVCLDAPYPASAGISLEAGYWKLIMDYVPTAWDGTYHKSFGGGPAGAYSLASTTLGEPPAIIIVTVP